MEEQKGALNRVRLLGSNSARASNTGAIFKTTSVEPFPLDRQTAIGGETRNAGHSLHNKSTEIRRSMWGLCWPASALSKTILSLSCLMTSFPPGAPSESNKRLITLWLCARQGLHTAHRTRVRKKKHTEKHLPSALHFSTAYSPIAYKKDLDF